MDLESLCRHCGAQFVHATLKSIDRTENVVIATGDQGEVRVPFDYIVVNVGSVTRAAEAFVDRTLPRILLTRPISSLIDRISALDSAMAGEGETRPMRNLVVVGGGAAGVEIAFALRARHPDADIKLLDSGDSPPLHSMGRWFSYNVANALQAKRIAYVHPVSCVGASETSLTLSDGSALPYDMAVVATGAGAPPVLKQLHLQLDHWGFLSVSDTLQCPEDARIFACGDCCSMVGRKVPKAGVFAVRQGPVVAQSLRALIAGGEALRYEPQASFLALINVCDGTAISRWNYASLHNSWMLSLKEKLDFDFMRRFQY